jgi:hypothetical protein
MAISSQHDVFCTNLGSMFLNSFFIMAISTQNDVFKTKMTLVFKIKMRNFKIVFQMDIVTIVHYLILHIICCETHNRERDGILIM